MQRGLGNDGWLTGYMWKDYLYFEAKYMWSNFQNVSSSALAIFEAQGIRMEDRT
jgi:hypothetical protein